MAIKINGAANLVLLVMKLVVVWLSDSVSVLASLVDAALDFLSTTIVFITTYMIANTDTYKYPVGQRRLESVGVLIFAVIMITAFIQVAGEGLQKLVCFSNHADLSRKTPTSGNFRSYSRCTESLQYGSNEPLVAAGNLSLTHLVRRMLTLDLSDRF